MAIKTNLTINDPAIKEFDKIIHSFSRSVWEVYCDFLHLTLDMMLSDHTPEHPREKHYMSIIRKYPKAEVEKFVSMLALVMMYMQHKNREVLSELWENYCANSDLGQFFTPWNLCEAMAEMSFPKNIDWTKYEERKYGISDPSCGGGRTLVAAMHQIPAAHMGDCLFHGIDIDGNVCNVAALNMLFFNANSYICHGNALSLEVYHVYETKHSPFGGEIREITDPEVMKRIITMGLSERKKEEPAAKAQENIKKEYKQDETGQLLLF